MKTIAVSDLHLSHRNYSDKKFNYLKKLFGEYDEIIINGDLWCGFTSSFEQFYNSKWSQLFDILKSKKCIYIPGNHDLKKYFDDRIYEIFDFISDSYKFSYESLNLLFMHGHQFTIDRQKSDFETRLRRLFYIESIPLALEKLVVTLFGYRFYSFFMNMTVNQLQRTKLNKVYKNTDEIRVVGHTHAYALQPKNRYINTGRIGKGYASYLSIVDGKYELKYERF